jgi:hypothetical protein
MVVSAKVLERRAVFGMGNSSSCSAEMILSRYDFAMLARMVVEERV